MSLYSKWMVWIIGLVVLGCGEKIQDFDPNKDRLEGKIAGEAWAYRTGNLRYSTSINALTGLIVDFDVQEPCGVRLTSQPHVELRIPAQRGNYDLNSFTDNRLYLKLHHENSTKIYTATAGFVEVLAISQLEAMGFISAEFDENNKVQGSFLLRICN
ncbi:hypothetical protein [Marinoscillum furvescens]|uniref:Uncharacterized protein n=1 Tax=Marinoscillum furvescens DSM 4134 TaxID=1122208 RepID=A0A3D9L8C8_MARFU|nr:hypothetical protein [Marinoscillum furvescens]REE01735.1 hypothetical protein C7460_103252 [Marinoscillum furvescens DSM 4134]